MIMMIVEGNFWGLMQITAKCLSMIILTWTSLDRDELRYSGGRSSLPKLRLSSLFALLNTDALTNKTGGTIYIIEFRLANFVYLYRSVSYVNIEIN